MAEPNDAAVLARAKALAAEDGFTWELTFGTPVTPLGPLRGQHFLSKDSQEEYLERARAELRKEGSNA